MRARILLLCTLIVCLLAMPVIGAELTVQRTDQKPVLAGDTVPLTLALTGAQDGISGFIITIGTSDAGRLTFSNATLADWVFLAEIEPSGEEPGYIKGVDLTQQAGSGEGTIHIGTLIFSALRPGTVLITITPSIIEDDYGGYYNSESVDIPIQIAIPSGPSNGGSYTPHTPAPTPEPTPEPTLLPTIPPEETPVPAVDDENNDDGNDLPPFQEEEPQLYEEKKPDLDPDDENMLPYTEPPVQQSPPGVLLPFTAALILVVRSMVRHKNAC